MLLKEKAHLTFFNAGDGASSLYVSRKTVSERHFFEIHTHLKLEAQNIFVSVHPVLFLY